MQPAAERFWATLGRQDGVALREGPQQLSYAQLREEVANRADQLVRLGVRRVALALDNGLEWALWDLALLRAELVCVPLPGFFSPAQHAHVLQHAGIDCVIGTANPLTEASGFEATAPGVLQRPLHSVTSVPAGTLKMPFWPLAALTHVRAGLEPSKTARSSR